MEDINQFEFHFINSVRKLSNRMKECKDLDNIYSKFSQLYRLVSNIRKALFAVHKMQYIEKDSKKIYLIENSPIFKEKCDVVKRMYPPPEPSQEFIQYVIFMYMCTYVDTKKFYKITLYNIK